MLVFKWLKGMIVSDDPDQRMDILERIEGAIERGLVVWVEVLLGCHYSKAHPGQVEWLVNRLPSFNPECLTDDVVAVYQRLYLIGDDRLDLVRKVRVGLGPMTSWNKDTLTRLETNLRLEREAEIEQNPLGEER